MDIKQMTAITALNAMMRSKHFSICTIREIATMLDVTPDREAMSVLQNLHCVDYSAMPRELVASLPALIQKALSGHDVFQFDLKKRDEFPVISMMVEEKPRGLLQRVFGGKP